MHSNLYTCVRVRVTRLCIQYPFICTCENRPGLCVRAQVCDGDGSAVCARVGGLVLRARPKPRNREPCEPLPVGVDRVRLRRAGVPSCVGVQRQHRRVEHRACHHVVLGIRRSRPGCTHYGGRARPGFDSARPVVRGCTADARARCAHVQALALRGAMGAGTAARRGGSVHVSE
jgi:hypothetical protein